MTPWIHEFGEEFSIPAEVLALVKSGHLFDMSWHNDACPSFATVQADSADATQEGAKVLWVEHPSPDSREFPGSARYGVTVMGDGWDVKDTIYNGDDLAAALAAIAEAK